MICINFVCILDYILIVIFKTIMLGYMLFELLKLNYVA